MVNEVNKLIYNALAEHNAVTLPDVGSLRVVRRAAQMEGNRVVAPTFAIEFSSAEEGLSLCDIIASVANVSANDARDIYLRWLDKVREDNTLTISGVGALKDKTFVSDSSLVKALNIADRTPIKIHHRRKSYPYIAAIVVLLLGAGAYLCILSDRVATPSVAEPETTAIAEASEPIVCEVVPAEPTPEPEPAKWSDSNDIRHWVVVGSYSTHENAERAIRSIVSEQKADCCEVLPLGKMYAVAVFGSGDKVECERFVRDNRHIFKQSWVHTPKRFK